MPGALDLVGSACHRDAQRQLPGSVQARLLSWTGATHHFEPLAADAGELTFAGGLPVSALGVPVTGLDATGADPEPEPDAEAIVDRTFRFPRMVPSPEFRVSPVDSTPTLVIFLDAFRSDLGLAAGVAIAAVAGEPTVEPGGPTGRSGGDAGGGDGEACARHTEAENNEMQATAAATAVV